MQTILFAVTGMSPAILTETVWALANGKPCIIPDRIVVLTTRAGADRIRAELFTPVNEAGGITVWERFLKTLAKKKLPVSGKLRFGATSDDIRVFTAFDKRKSRSVELEDIRTPEDNSAVADFILEKLRSYTENPDIRIVASIAGGRKTMGALLYACMTLVGRETDRLTHVLVNEPFDSPALKPKFYFPVPKTKAVYGKAPVIELAEVPFVPLRNRFAEIADMPGNFSSLILKYSRGLEDHRSGPVNIRLSEKTCSVSVDDKTVALRTRAFYTLCYMIHANSPDGKMPVGQPEAVGPMKTFLGEAGDWVQNADDIKRELSEIRKRLQSAGVLWGPGVRKYSLILPPFNLQK